MFGKIRQIKFDMPTCKSMDALAQSTELVEDGNPFKKPRFKLIILLGEELTRIVTSSIPSLLIMDHPSSAKPFRASLKPLQVYTY